MYICQVIRGGLISISMCACVWQDGLIGMAVVGGAAAVAIGSIIGLGVALSRK